MAYTGILQVEKTVKTIMKFWNKVTKRKQNSVSFVFPCSSVKKGKYLDCRLRLWKQRSQRGWSLSRNEKRAVLDRTFPDLSGSYTTKPREDRRKGDSRKRKKTWRLREDVALPIPHNGDLWGHQTVVPLNGPAETLPSRRDENRHRKQQQIYHSFI